MLSDFNPETSIISSRKDTFSAVIVGSRRQGKTYLTEYLLKSLIIGKYDLYVVFCNSKVVENYLSFVPSRLVFHVYDKSVIKAISKKQHDELARSGKLLRIIYIFDDAISKQQIYDPEILQLFTCGRNNNSSIIYLSQSITLLSTDWRENIDFLFLFRQKSASKKQKVIDDFLKDRVTPGEGSDKDFSIFLDAVTENHQCLIIDFESEDEIKKFRAP